MNKRILLRLAVLYAFINFLIFFSIGCEQSISNNDYYKLQAAAEKVQQIEVLDLRGMKAKDESRPEANSVPPEEIKLTLEQCRALALENNLDLKVQLIAPAIAAQRVSEQEAQFESAFFSNITYNKTNTATASTLSSAKMDSTNVNLGVKMPLRTGGTVTFDLTDNRTQTNNIFATINPSYQANTSISISQPLLRNAGNRANTYAIRIAEYDRQMVNAQTKLEVIRVIADADRWYWRLYAARRQLEVRKDEYELAKAQLEQAKRFVDAGERAIVEVIRAEAGVAERLEAIIVAENTLRERERELKRLLNKSGLNMQTSTVLIPGTEPDLVHYELDKQPLVGKAIENRMEMLELELQIVSDVSKVDYLKNQMLPLVTLNYNYNINGVGATRDDSYDMLASKDFEDHQLGLQLLVPLGNEAAKSRLLAAFYEQRQRLVTRQNRQASIELEVLNALDLLEANWQRILAGRQNTILTGRLFEAEKRQFELGLRTSTDVLDAQTKFANAQSAEISAIADYQIAIVDLAYATGTLLGAAKVQWEPIVPQTSVK